MFNVRIIQVIDPWAGSYMMESLTDQVYQSALELINEIEEMGGMAKAIVAGVPKLKIEECAARRQAMIDDGKETIVGEFDLSCSNDNVSFDCLSRKCFLRSGVNKYKLEKEDLIQVLQIDNKQVREQQIGKLGKVKRERDQGKVQSSLDNLRRIAADKTSKENLLEATIDAARVRATLGEISQALEDVFTRHVADSRLVSGAYRKTFDDDRNQNELKNVIQRVEVRCTIDLSSN